MVILNQEQLRYYRFEHPVTILKVYVEWLNLVEDALIEKLLSGVTPNFIWSHQRNKLEWKRLRKDQVGKLIYLYFLPSVIIILRSNRIFTILYSNVLEIHGFV